MKTSPRLEPPLLPVRRNNVVAGIGDPDWDNCHARARAGISDAGHNAWSRLVSAPKLWPTEQHHVRRPDWTEVFFDLIFAAAISQLSSPLEANFSVPGVLRYAFLLALVFLAWFGYTGFSTRYAIDDVLQRALTIAQVFLVAVMAANATGALSSKDTAGFGAAYGGVRAILALQYIRVRRLGDCRVLVRRRIGGLLFSALIWAVSALLPAPQRYAGWAVAFLIDIGNSWPPSRSTTASPPGATHFPERFGLLTAILLGEFVASVMRGIESQMEWSFLAASAAVLSLALGFAIWSCYSDGAHGSEARHVRSHKDVVRLRVWIASHFVLFLGIGVLGVGVRRAIAFPAGAHFTPAEQWIICAAAATIVGAIARIAASSEHVATATKRVTFPQLGLVLITLSLAPFASQLTTSAVVFALFLCYLAQTAMLVGSKQSASFTMEAHDLHC